MDKSIVTFSTWKRSLVETTALDSQDIFFGRYVVFSHNSGGFVDETGVGQLFSIASKFLEGWLSGEQLTIELNQVLGG